MRTLNGSVVAAIALVSGARAQPAESRQARAKPVIDKAIAYLRTQQDQASGGWSVPKEGPVYPAVTALVLNGMLMQPGITAEDGAVKTGVAFVLKYRQADGGIYDKVLPSYNTSIVLSILACVG